MNRIEQPVDSAPGPTTADTTPSQQIRESEKHTVSHSKTQRKRHCANHYCVTRPELIKLERLGFNGIQSFFCQFCAESIRKKWVCFFCKYICVEGDTNYDNGGWVQCDSTRCNSWTHIDCERNYGQSNISELLADEQTKYFCPSCRGGKNSKKGGADASKPEMRRSDKFTNIDDFRKTMISRRRTATMNYTYLHSENYQSIEKLVSNYENGVYSLMLKENELANDLKIFNSCLGKNAFEVPNSADKSTSFKSENLEKRSLKRFMRGSVRN
jgi:hypothetical protein